MTAALVAGVTATSVHGQHGQQTPTEASGVAEPVAGSISGRSLERLERAAEDPRLSDSPEALLLRNLSRYWARYPMPTDQAEFRRLLGTLHRITAQVAAGFLQALEEGARQTGLGVVTPDFVAGLLAHSLPASANEFGELIFFPAAPPAGRLAVETIDLESFAATGVAWRALSDLDEGALYPAGDPRPLSDAALERLHDGVNAYALLVLRLAGLHARSELEPHVATRHLRAAARTIVAADASEIVPTVPDPAADDFLDVTAAAGLDFRHVTSDWLSSFRRFGPLAPTFSGGGVTAADLDGDRWPDLVLCGGRGCSWFRNLGDGTFEDRTQAAGLEFDGEARMAVAADFDNDGDRDLFFTVARDSDRLFANDGQGGFTDVTAESGLGEAGSISGPATAVDIDNDGLLDLYVGRFGNYLEGNHPWSGGSAENAQPNVLFRNLGGMRFERLSDDGNTGWAQALSHADLDLDGDQDLYVANDFGRNALLLNDGKGRFESIGEQAGADDRHHGMNVSFADLDGDRKPDVFVTNIWVWDPIEESPIETNTLLLSGPATPGDPPESPPTYRRFEDSEFLSHDTGWAWAGEFLDYDLDGDEDLFVANGFTDYLTFTQDRLHPDGSGRTYPINNSREANLLLRRDEPLDFEPVATALALQGYNSRGAVSVDYDLDGDPDLAVSTFHAEARLFRNELPHGERSWLLFDLVGAPERGVNLDAIGAQLLVTDDDGFAAWRAVSGGGGYLSHRAGSVHIGVGERSSVEVEVLWPDGSSERFGRLATGARYELRFGAGTARPVTPPPVGSPSP